MTAFQAGDTVRFRNTYDADDNAGWYAGVLSEDHGYLRIDGADFTEHPDHYRPSGWRVIRPDGAPYSHYITDLTLIHRPAQEGTIMNTTVRLREGDRITYRHHGDGPITSGPLRPTTVYCTGLIDEDHGNYITDSRDKGPHADGVSDVTLIERHGLPVVTQELEGYGQCVIYITLQDTDEMYFMQVEHAGVNGPCTSVALRRMGVPVHHPLYTDDARWDWATTSEIDAAGVDRSQWPTPLRLVDNVTPENDVSATSRIAELEAALEAEREERKREMLDYKAQVKAMARQVGADHGWCVPGQNEVLRDLGIETRTKSRVSVALEFDMVAFTDTEDPTRGFAQDSLSQLVSMGEVVAALRELIDLDSDWDDVVFDESSINFRVTGVEEEQ